VAQVETTPLRIAGRESYFLCAASLTILPLDQHVHYRVVQVCSDWKRTFLPRENPEQQVRFIVTGDLASGMPGNFRSPVRWRVEPQFVLVCGILRMNATDFRLFGQILAGV